MEHIGHGAASTRVTAEQWTDHDDPSVPASRWVWIRFATLVILLAAGAVAVWRYPLPDRHELAGSLADDPWAPVVFAGLYVLATFSFIPKNVLSAAAGLLFGLALGVLLVWVAAVGGAVAAFWLGRLLGRDAVRRVVAGDHLRRLDHLIDRHGTTALLTVRLVPLVPFTVVNYGSGLLGVGLGAYVVTTMVGILPGTLAYVALGAYGASPTSWPFLLAAAAILAASIIGAWQLRRRTRQERP